MRRIIIQGLLAWLIGLLPLLAAGQTLTRYEYWFDDDFSHRVSGSLSGTEREVNKRVSTEGLSDGIHRINFRARQSDGSYSAITSSVFLKLDRPANTVLEYWFDDNHDQRESIPISASGEEESLSLDLRNNTKYPFGFHWLKLRAVVAGAGSTSVCAEPVLKLAAGVANKLDYWVDGDFSNMRTLEGHNASDGNGYVYVTDLDMQDVTPGYHRLYCRTRSSSGYTSSAVTMSPFIKVSSGNASTLEYWLDGDRSNVQVLNGTQASDGNGYVFVDDLDLGDVTPGHHRLYCRARSGSGGTATAVTMTPIIVKSRYYHDENEPVTVDKYSITVDNGEMTMYDVATPREIITQTHIYDASKLSPGNHTVKATFWNSLDASVSVEQAFKVIAPEEPSITLTAQQEGGLVKLHFNSIPKDKGYRLYRTLGTGTPKIVDHMTGGIYPSDVDYNDNPAAGTYKYQAWIPYTDRDGTSEVLKSNEVSVTVTKALTEEEAATQYGTVAGCIVCDKNTPTSGLRVRFSNDDKTVPVQGVLFTRVKMPQGTEVTLTVEGDETHKYDTVTVTVGEGITNVTINGTWNDEFQPNNQTSDLIIASDMEMINDLDATYLKFTVKNRSRDKWWYGKVRVRAIDKKKADNAHMDINEMGYGSHNMFTGESDQLRLKAIDAEGNGSATAEVTITLDGLYLKKDKDFYLYFESVGLWGGEGYTEEIKPITGNSHYNVNMNPIVWNIHRTVGDMEVWDNEAKETFAYLALAMSCVTPGMSGLVGDLSPLVKDVLNYTGQSETTEAAKIIADWFKNKPTLEVLSDPNVFNITSAVRSSINDVYKKCETPLIERFWRKIGGNVANSLSATKLISEMRNIATVVKSDDLFEQTMACAKLLYAGLYLGQNTPLSNMMYTYMIVGKSMINAVNEYANIVAGRYIVHRLNQNRVYTGGTAGQMNTAIDFKIIIKDSEGVIDFTNDNYAKQIKSISVKVAKLKARYDDDGDGVYTVELFPPATFSFTPEFMTDCIMLKTDGNGVTDGNIEEFSEIASFYIEIHWKDESVSYIPLIKSTDGVKIKHKDTQNDTNNFKEPFVYTVTLTTATGRNHIADNIFLGNNKDRE